MLKVQLPEMGWEAQVSTPCSAYPRKPSPRMKSAMTEYSLRTKQILQSGDQVGISRCYAGYLRRKMLLISYAIGGLSEQIEWEADIGVA